MKKPSLDIKKMNNDDVIATSGTDITCEVNLSEYDTLFQSNGYCGNVSFMREFGVKENDYFDYSGGSWSQSNKTSFYTYTYGNPAVEDGKWYHIHISTNPSQGATVVECTDPNHHGQN